MNKKLLASEVLSVLSFGVLADTPTYDYVEAGYSSVDFEGLPALTGFEIKGSHSLSDNFYVAGDHTNVSKNGFDLRLTTIGLGYNMDVTSNSSFFTELDYASIDADGAGNENGYEITTGIRSMLTEKLELKAAVEYLEIDNDDTTSFVFGAAYKIDDSFAVYADYKLESDLNRIGLGVRFSF